MNVYFFVLGSNIARWRAARSIGKALADGWSEPALHHAGLSGARTVAASQRRPSRPNIELWLLTRVSQMRSPPQYGDGCSASRPAAWPGPRLSGISGALTGALKGVAVFSTGSRIGRLSELYSGDPYSGPFAFTVGKRRSLEMRSWRYCFSFIQSRSVTTMLRSTPCGRGGLANGSSPLAIRSVQSPKYLNGAPPSSPAAILIMFSPA